MSSEPPSAASEDERLETLRRTYERICGERDRLRDARGFFARALGPAPASAGISTALVATFAHTRDEVFLWLAVGALVALVVAGMLYGGKPAYRHLYAREIERLRERLRTDSSLRTGTDVAPGAPLEDQLLPRDWYGAMIDLERKIYGPDDDRNHVRWPWETISTLQGGLDAERTGVWIVQLLWLAVIVLLVLSVVV